MIELVGVEQKLTEQWWSLAASAMATNQNYKLRKFEDTLLPTFIRAEDLTQFNTLWALTSLPWTDSEDETIESLETLWSIQSAPKPEWAYNPAVLGVGNMHPKYVFMGLNPGWDQNHDMVTHDRTFTYGKTSVLLRESLYKEKMIADTWLTNIMKWSTEKNKVKPTQLNECYPLVEEEIKELQPDYVFGMGKDCYSKLTKLDIHCPVIPLLHPTYFFYYMPNGKEVANSRDYGQHIKMQMETTIV